MMENSGNLLKMKTSFERGVVDYTLVLENKEINMNDLIGTPVSVEFEHQINCIKCGKVTPKSYGQGFCFPCFRSAPEADECILRPERCQAHLGISRDMEWSKSHCLTDHFVYLALSSGLKVGVTRATQIPTRWIDQGALKAVKIAKTPNRFLAGQIEVALKAFMADKTNWRNMLTNTIDEGVDLLKEKARIPELLDEELAAYLIDDDQMQELNYPVQEYPIKVKSMGLDKNPSIKGILKGIKGQYLIFDEGRVMNVRNHSGYRVTLRY